MSIKNKRYDKRNVEKSLLKFGQKLWNGADKAKNKVRMTKLETTLVKFGAKLVNEMKAILEKHDKDATGTLLKSLTSYTEDEDGLTYLYLKMASYATYVDSGRRPGLKRPPRKDIRKWITDKGIRGRNANGRFMKADSLAFLIQRKIGIEGIDPLPFLHIFQDSADELADLVEDTAVNDLQSQIDEFIKDYNKNNI